MAGEFRVLHPCTRDRESLTGDGAVRWCPDCRKNVYDFARMRRREVDRVVASGDCCGIVEHRADGTLRTADPPPLRRRFLRWFAAFAGMGARWAWAQQQPPLAEGTGGIRGEVVKVSGARVTVADHATFTDTDGHFLLTGLTPGSVAVMVEAAGFAKQSFTVNVVAGEFATLPSIKLKAATGGLTGQAIRPVEVVVTDATGGPIPNARVTLTDGTGQVVKELRTEGWTGRARFGDIEQGNYTLTVECAGFKKYSRPVSAPTSQVVLEVGSVGDVVVVETNPVRRLINRLRHY